MQIESKHPRNMVADTTPYVFSIGCIYETTGITAHQYTVKTELT